jgi:translation initiation factor 1A
MVKNSGGNKAKRFARFNAPSTFRSAKEEGEIYGIIEKNMGNGICTVLCIDSITRLCILRKKFARLHVQPGTWVLVGLREFETKKDKCDLLEVYTPADVARLQTMDGAWHILSKEQVEFEEAPPEIETSDPVKLDMDVDFDDI